MPEGEVTVSSQHCNDLNHQGTEAGLNISFVPDSDDLSITVDGEEWFRSSIELEEFYKSNLF